MMRNVQRVTKPMCLQRNGARWKREYLEAIKNNDTKLIVRRRSRYNHQEVREALGNMYRNLCCYCEAEVRAVGADQIEHRKPVRRFPEHAFDWGNLHLACARCNRAKSDQWAGAQPILDAVIDTPINKHLDYESSDTGVRRRGMTLRGRTTVKHADLNREELRVARNSVMLHVVGIIQEVRKRRSSDPGDIKASNIIDHLKEMYSGPYGSMIRWAVSTLLDEEVAA